jgi:hypothetical protein
MHRITRNRRTTGKHDLPKAQSRSLKIEPNPRQSRRQDQPKAILRSPAASRAGGDKSGGKPRHASPGTRNASGTACRTS